MKRTIASTALLFGTIAAVGLNLSSQSDDMRFVSPAMAASTEIATFAGGCFWCVESDFEAIPGVKEAVSGYTGGKIPNPTYRNHGRHIEAVQIFYDPGKVSYQQLVDTFWRTVNPLDAGGQFCDRGHSYTTAIFANNAQQAAIAKKSKANAEAALGKKIVTPIRTAGKFTNAEGYHQNYYKVNPVRYKYYRNGCGRNKTVKAIWGSQAYKGVPKH